METIDASPPVPLFESGDTILETLSAVAVIVVDLRACIVSWNAGAERLFGYTRSQIAGEPFERLFVPEDRAAGVVAYELDKAEREGRAEDVRWHLRADGSRFWANGVTTALRADDGTLRGFVKVTRDDTERHLAETELCKAREALETALEAGNIAVWSWDVINDRVITDARLFRWFGVPQREQGVPIAEYLKAIHPDDLSRNEALLQSALDNGGSYEAEFRVIGPDGIMRWAVSQGEAELDDSNRVIRLSGVTVDISNRRRAEEAARESERQFQMLADSIPQLAWMAGRDGAIFWYNQRWFEYTGTTFEEMRGWGWQSVHHPDEVERVTECFKSHVASGEPWEDTFPLLGRDGQFRWFLSRAQPIRDASGNIVRWFGTNTDIEELRRARQSAEDANRLKDEFLATLSHELRTPLNAIMGWSHILRSGELDEETTNRALEVIERNARAQSQLIEDILDVSRIMSSKLNLDFARVDLIALVNHVIEAVMPSAQAKNLRLSVEHEPGVRHVRGDATRLQQIVSNLLSNAIKFTPEGGSVRVQLESEKSNAGARYQTVLTVSDTGQGIDAEFLPHVFDRFRQADSSSTRRHAGLGLGLAIVRHLVELHDGDIEVHSDGLGQGARFRVRLPQLEAEPLRSGGTAALDGVGTKPNLRCPPELSGLRVLVVDDEPDARRLAHEILMRCGARVATAASVEEALAEIERERPEVLVSDVGMPERDGYSLISEVRSAEAELHLMPMAAVALTAFVRPEDRVRALEAGFDNHVSKPVAPAELIAVVAGLARVLRVRA